MKLIRPGDRTSDKAGPVTRPVHLPYDPQACKIGGCLQAGYCQKKNGCVTPVFMLDCKCYTTREEQERAALWRPKGKRYWCEKHGWRRDRKRRKVPPIPEEPMF